jgi:hypothetical protein
MHGRRERKKERKKESEKRILIAHDERELFWGREQLD